MANDKSKTPAPKAPAKPLDFGSVAEKLGKLSAKVKRAGKAAKKANENDPRLGAMRIVLASIEGAAREAAKLAPPPGAATAPF